MIYPGIYRKQKTFGMMKINNKKTLFISAVPKNLVKVGFGDQILSSILQFLSCIL